jgi:hypothetical protein
VRANQLPCGGEEEEKSRLAPGHVGGKGPLPQLGSPGAEPAAAPWKRKPTSAGAWNCAMSWQRLDQWQPQRATSHARARGLSSQGAKFARLFIKDAHLTHSRMEPRA